MASNPVRDWLEAICDQFLSHGQEVGPGQHLPHFRPSRDNGSRYTPNLPAPGYRNGFADESAHSSLRVTQKKGILL